MPNPESGPIRAALSAAANARGARLLRGPNPVDRFRGTTERPGYLDKDLALRLARTRRDSTEAAQSHTDLLARLRQVSPEHKAALVTSSKSTMAGLKATVAGWRAAKELLASRAPGLLAPELNFNFVVLDTPAFILPSGDINIVGESVAPWNNVVKFNGEWSSPSSDFTEGFGAASYVFAWTNTADRPVVLNAESYAVINGFCEIFVGSGGFFTIDQGVIGGNIFLHVLQWWQDPPTEPDFQVGQFANTFSVSADGGAAWPFGLGDYESAAFSGTYDVRYNSLSVPAGGTVVFEMQVGYGYGTRGRDDRAGCGER